MICLKCEKNKFIEKKVKIEQEFREKKFNIISEAMVCLNCGQEFLNDEQANVLRKKTVDQYRLLNGLLTSVQIKSYRDNLKMSQATFADYLGVGVASVKRWETYFVQDKSQDDLLRIKCDPDFADINALEVRWALDQPDEYNGYKKFDIDVFRNVLIRILEVAPSPLFFFKAIFYIDFVHFKNFGKGITGMKYACLQYGPIPKDYEKLIKYAQVKGWVSKLSTHDLKANLNFDEKFFSTDEMTTINSIYDIAKKKGRKFLFNRSHEEAAFKSCHFLDVLNYKDSKKIKLL
jgi:putative zinc finger/helix-turn-helix YgiT family protein